MVATVDGLVADFVSITELAVIRANVAGMIRARSAVAPIITVAEKTIVAGDAVVSGPLRCRYILLPGSLIGL